MSLYEYRIRVVSVYDGDTLRADIDLGFFTWRMNEQFRLYGVNTPELRGGTAETKRRAIEARDFVRKWVSNHEGMTAVTDRDRSGKYGRFLATIYNKNRLCLNDELIRLGYAVPYMRDR